MSDVREEKKRWTAKKIARGVLMNVFINTSAKVKQNKLTKQSKRYDDGFHDSDTHKTNTQSHGNVTQKYPCIFHTEEPAAEAAVYTAQQPRMNERQSKLARCYRQRQKMSRRIVIFLLSDALCCCRFMFVICVASYAVTSACSRSCTLVALSRKPTNWIHMVRLATAAAVAQHNKTIHMHTQNDRFYSNSSSRAAGRRRGEKSKHRNRLKMLLVCC